ncbi:hypothetical protein LSH36_142g06030 [Paralvinella palmiformis]|uniref:Uncharacterized protein n=1 Tax=Paralvinella palmiformis TaxID=53620 RepID=A0AAD9N9I1_9ANNE|nr:hypothetical protein LSH36_142g06030 [Paralvinella palmiformis]
MIQVRPENVAARRAIPRQLFLKSPVIQANATVLFIEIGNPRTAKEFGLQDQHQHNADMIYVYVFTVQHNLIIRNHTRIVAVIALRRTPPGCGLESELNVCPWAKMCPGCCNSCRKETIQSFTVFVFRSNITKFERAYGFKKAYVARSMKTKKINSLSYPLPKPNNVQCRNMLGD